MDYLVEFIITIPDDAPLPEMEQRLAGETPASPSSPPRGMHCGSGSRCPRKWSCSRRARDRGVSCSRISARGIRPGSLLAVDLSSTWTG